MDINKIRDENGKLPTFAWPGGYAIRYFARDNGILCAGCANDFKPGRDNEEQLEAVAYDILEGEEDAHESLCEHCGKACDPSVEQELRAEEIEEAEAAANGDSQE